MEKNINKALTDFVDVDDEVQNEKLEPNKEAIINERSGLIERVDRILVTKDGRQLLREQY